MPIPVNNSRSTLVAMLALCVLAQPAAALGNADTNSSVNNEIAGTVEDFITGENNYTYFGLASYYNNTTYYVVDDTSVSKLENEQTLTLGPDEWFVVVSRLNALVVKAPGLLVQLVDADLNIDDQDVLTSPSVYTVAKPELSSIAKELDQVRYAQLWKPLAWLARLIESALVFIHESIISSWGLSIVVLAILIKIVLLPVGVFTARIQRDVSQVQAKLAPKLEAIKASYDGEEAHNLMMAAHKELGVSPLYTLKPMLGTFIQVPIWIAVFNALGEMPQLDGQSFLWIENLAFPDAVGQLAFAVPMFGDKISLLPLIMTIVTIGSTVLFKNRHATESEMRRQRRNLYLMAVAFFVLFYPFPAAMVLYWTLANILYAFQQQLIKI